MKPVDGTQVQTSRFYDEEAGSYDASRYSSAAGRHVDAFHKRVLEEGLFADLRPQARVLELGCGTGRLAAHFAARCELTGLDASEGMLARARARPELRGAELLRGSAYTLPFPDSSFDAAYAILVLNLLPDYARAIAEVGRVLRPGGRFLFNVPNLLSMYAPGGLYVNLRGRTTGANQAGHRYSHWFTRGEVRRALAAAGLTITVLRGQPPLIGRGLMSASLPGGLPASLLCKSLYYSVVRR